MQNRKRAARFDEKTGAFWVLSVVAVAKCPTVGLRGSQTPRNEATVRDFGFRIVTEIAYKFNQPKTEKITSSLFFHELPGVIMSVMVCVIMCHHLCVILGMFQNANNVRDCKIENLQWKTTNYYGSRIFSLALDPEVYDRSFISINFSKN